MSPGVSTDRPARAKMARIASPAGTLLKLTLTRAVTSGATTRLTPAWSANHKSSVRASALLVATETSFVAPNAATESLAGAGTILTPAESDGLIA